MLVYCRIDAHKDAPQSPTSSSSLPSPTLLPPSLCTVHEFTAYRSLASSLQLPDMFPGLLMNLQVYAREVPLFSFQPGAVKLGLLGAVKAFAIQANGTQTPLFKLNVVSTFVFWPISVYQRMKTCKCLCLFLLWKLKYIWTNSCTVRHYICASLKVHHGKFWPQKNMVCKTNSIM